jgi:hypothetical protein
LRRGRSLAALLNDDGGELCTMIENQLSFFMQGFVLA